MNLLPIHRYVMKLTAIASICTICVLGCDSGKPTPPANPGKESASAATRPASALATRPTTQQLINGPRHPLVLGALPLIMDVPESWKLETTAGGSGWLVGPTPHGEVRIQLTSTVTPFNTATLTLMDEQLRKEAAASHGDIEAKPLRSLGGGAKVREQRESRPGAIVDDQGTTVATEIMDWSVEVYVPQDKAYRLDILHFAMLSAGQYKQDRDFLDKIVATLRYDATKGLLQ